MRMIVYCQGNDDALQQFTLPGARRSRDQSVRAMPGLVHIKMEQAAPSLNPDRYAHSLEGLIP
ncbi:hypothetical protein D3C77_329030 [compost metagenome]